MIRQAEGGVSADTLPALNTIATAKGQCAFLFYHDSRALLCAPSRPFNQVHISKHEELDHVANTFE